VSELLQSEAPTLPRIVQDGLPTEAPVTRVLAAKYADHLPLLTAGQVYARQGLRTFGWSCEMVWLLY
jgi:transposase